MGMGSALGKGEGEGEWMRQSRALVPNSYGEQVRSVYGVHTVTSRYSVLRTVPSYYSRSHT
jgi:hypothetical protein